MIFKKPANPLEGNLRIEQLAGEHTTDDYSVACPRCKKTLSAGELAGNHSVCPYCNHHFRLSARQRIALLCDNGSFAERDADLPVANPIDFPGYGQKLEQAHLASSESEAVICGTARIGGCEVALFVMEPFFMMGSMGTVVGEKITRLFERATERRLPVIGYTVSGGARMQEGILSLMQMAKTSGAVKRHSDAGLLFIAVLTDPTTGGVTASFAMEADILLAEPFALIGFAGPRVIEQTIRKKLPEGFQRAEFLLQKGFLDNIVNRRRQRGYLRTLLRLHREEVSQ